MLSSFCLIVLLSWSEAVSVNPPGLAHADHPSIEFSKSLLGQKVGLAPVEKAHTLDTLVQLQDSPSTVSTTSTVSWGSQIKNALASFLIGLICFLLSFPILIWNECKSARQYRLLDGAEKVVKKNLNATELSRENQGKLVHVQGEIKVVETLGDTTFGIQVQGCVKFKRIVKMYQWEEHVRETREDNLGGSQTVRRTYSYEKRWSESPISSNGFQEQQGHRNPEFPIYRSDNWEVKRAHFGDYILGPPLIDQATWWADHEVTEKDLSTVEESVGKELKVVGGNFYRGKSEQYPEIGDIKVEFQKVTCDVATVMGRQMGNSFEGWEPVFCPCTEERVDEDAKYNEEKQRLLAKEAEFTVRLDHILYLTRDHVSAYYIIEQRRTANQWVTWLWRLLGFIMMCGGLDAMFQPLIVLLKVIPFIANIASAGIFIAAFITTLVLTLVIVSLAWVLARPLLVGCLVSIGVGIVILVSLVK